MSYEYKVVPAPVRGLKAKGVKTAEDRFANALETAINELASDGWDYIRADTLPCEQREDLMSKTTVYQNMLVFRRKKAAAKPAQTLSQPPLAAPMPKPAETEMVEKKAVAAPKSPAPASDAEEAPDKRPGSSPDVAAE